MSNIEIYSDGELELKVSINEDTIWLTQKQIAEVFDVNVPAISKHIKNIYKDNELEEFGTISVLEIVQNEGNREVLRSLEHYNLDIILAVGYRTNSSKAIKFRRWASKVLKSYINDGYVINTHKITEQRLSSLENDMSFIKSQIKNNTLEIKQGIFFNGQIFDAYIFVNDLIKSAKDEIILFDNYIDETVLTLLSKNPNINITLYTQNISKQLNLKPMLFDSYNWKSRIIMYHKAEIRTYFKFRKSTTEDTENMIEWLSKLTFSYRGSSVFSEKSHQI